MKKLNLVSLGMSCQTTHQLTRFANENPDKVTLQKGPFDWLICPPQSAADWLDADLPNFDPDEIVEERHHAYWPKYNFWFWHGFYTKRESGKILDINSNIERELSKLNYQRQQFREIDPSSTLFFISNIQNNLSTDVFTSDEKHLFYLDNQVVEKLKNSLDRYFGENSQLTWITQANRHDSELTNNSNCYLMNSEHSEWKGSDSDWNLLLHQIFQSTITQK